MGPKNGHMTQEVLIRVFPGFTHAQRKISFLYKGCGGSCAWQGGRVEDAYLAEDEVRLALRGRKCLCGVRRGRRRGKERETWSGPLGAAFLQSALLTAAALRCLMPVACSAKPTKCEARMSFCSWVQTSWDIIGAQWIFIWSMKNDGWVSEWLENKKITQRKPSFASI